MHKALLLKSKSKKLLSRLKHFITPRHHCLLCDESNDYRICNHCRGLLTKPLYSCQRCALPLRHFALFCGQCLKQPPAYDAVFSPYLYQLPLKQLLYDYKQKGQEYAGKALGDLFCQEISLYYQQQHLVLPTLITPVPLHWRDQWRRSFNQSEFFSYSLSKYLKLEHFTGIRRIKRTLPQKELTRQQRMTGLRNSFVVNGRLDGQSIAVVDDVMTTGATANAVALALKKAGAGEVTIWVLARTALN